MFANILAERRRGLWEGCAAAAFLAVVSIVQLAAFVTVLNGAVTVGTTSAVPVCGPSVTR